MPLSEGDGRSGKSKNRCNGELHLGVCFLMADGSLHELTLKDERAIDTRATRHSDISDV